MKERPILFSAPMVRAILDGRKTQTRRIVKPQPVHAFAFIGREDVPTGEFGLCLTHERVCDKHVSPPYGQPGDRIWVRGNGWERPERTPTMMREGADTWPKFAYDADGWSFQDHADFKAWGFKRRPSIHMPRWASRITLDVSGVRIEKLQDISEDDALAEGSCALTLNDPPSHESARDVYRVLWESINGAGSWSANQWVWVVEFKRVISG